MKPAILDNIDREILALVQGDAEMSAESIAAKVNLSPSAVQRRLARLKKEGVIERVGAIVDPRKVGLSLTVLAEVQCENNRLASHEAFRKWIRGQTAVQSCWHVAGDFDYVLVFIVRDFDTYVDLSSRMMSDSLGLKRLKTTAVLQTVKRGPAIDVA